MVGDRRTCEPGQLGYAGAEVGVGPKDRGQRSQPEKSVPLPITAPVRFASAMLRTPLNIVPVSLAPWKWAPVRSFPARSFPLRSQPWQLYGGAPVRVQSVAVEV